MKKIVLLSGVSAALLAINANAAEFSPYFSLKGSIAQIQNDTNAFSDYSYGGVTHHINTLSDKTHKDSVFGLKAAIGASQELKYGKLRGELEFGTSESSKEHNNFPFKISNDYVHDFDIKTSFYSAMLNLYYDIDTGTKFTPYIGGGIGYARVKSKAAVTGDTPFGAIDMNSSTHENNFAWQLGFGVSYQVTDNIDIDLGYRYSDYGNAKDSVATPIPGLDKTLYADAKYSITSHEALLGLRYSF